MAQPALYTLQQRAEHAFPVRNQNWSELALGSLCADRLDRNHSVIVGGGLSYLELGWRRGPLQWRREWRQVLDLFPLGDQAIEIVPEHLIECSIRAFDIGLFAGDRAGIGAVATLHSARAPDRSQFRGKVLDDAPRPPILQSSLQPSQVIGAVTTRDI